MDENDTGVEDDNDNNFLGDNWEWYQQAPIVDDYDVPIPPMNDCYNGRHGLKPMVASRFDTIILCVFRCSATNREFFQILSCQQNKYARYKKQAKEFKFVHWLEMEKYKCWRNGRVIQYHARNKFGTKKYWRVCLLLPVIT